MAFTLTCRSGCAKCTAKNIAFIVKFASYQHPSFRCLASAASLDVARASSSTTNERVTKRYIKFKSNMMEQMRRADRSVLLNLKLGASPTEELQKACDNLKLQNQLLQRNGDVKNLIRLADYLYLVEFERGWIHERNKMKCIDPTVTKYSDIASPKNFQGKNLTACIKQLYQTQKMPTAAVLAHFFVASYIKSLLRPIDRNVMVLPFGSTASGLGLRGLSDLDVVWVDVESSKDTDSYRDDLQKALRLVHLSKRRGQLEKIQRVLHARVPIIKFQYRQLEVNCDLSRGLITGPLMSEILFWLNEYDDRFYPLLMALKLLFRVHKVTGSAGPEITSNTLTMLVVAFLQKQKILPPLKEVFDFQLRVDSQWASTYLNACNPKPQPERDDTSLGVLFQQFLAYYNRLNFQEVCVDVYEGDIYSRSIGDKPMEIINPFDFGTNMSNNVSRKSLRYFQTRCNKVLIRINMTSADSFHSLWNAGFKTKDS